MRALGLAVDVPKSKRPAVRAVLLEDGQPASMRPTLADVVVVDTFEVPSGADDLATQLKELFEAVSGRVRSLRPDVVVVRRADMPPRASNADGPRFRLLAEGAVTAAARMLVVKTVVRTGRDCGLAYGALKDDVDQDARTLVATRLAAAGAAALAGLVAYRT